MTARPEHQIDAAFMPLFDSAVLIAAREVALQPREGVDLALHPRDLLGQHSRPFAIGHFDIAHMLGPMPIACNLGLTPLASETIVPFALGLGGNCVTVSNEVWEGWAGTARCPTSIRKRQGGRWARLSANAPSWQGTAALRCRAPAFRPLLRASLLAGGVRRRPAQGHRDRHPAAALHGRCAGGWPA